MNQPELTVVRPAPEVLLDMLSAARTRIVFHQERYICNALHMVYAKTSCADPQRSDRFNAYVYLTKYICTQLAGHATLEIWAAKVRGILMIYDHPENVAEMRAARIAWIDWMREGLEREIAELAQCDRIRDGVLRECDRMRERITKENERERFAP